jgi:hypothetical protein
MLAGASAAAPAMAQTSRGNAHGHSHPPFEMRSRSSHPWSPLRVVDTERMPWKQTAQRDEKTLFSNVQQESRLSIIHVFPRHSDWTSHYHTGPEWSFHLAGDMVNCEYTSPDQRVGALVRSKEGYFLDRPPYSLHGFESGRHLESQMGATLLLMSEGGHSVSPIPEHPVYSDEYKQVKEWARPRIIDTIEKMPWEPDPTVSGLQLKHLADDRGRGFRATLRCLPAGWNSSLSPNFARGFYYRQAYQFNLVLEGDLNIQIYRAPGEKAEKLTLGRHFYLERAPMSIFGLADRVVSERGCVWLEVTYAKGPSMSDTPIEEPTYV